MRKDIVVDVSAAGRARLEAIVADRNSPQKHVWRARIILLSVAGLGTVEIMRRTGKSKTCVWRWQERFMHEGIEGLRRDKTRASRIPPLGPQVAERVAQPAWLPVDEWLRLCIKLVAVADLIPGLHKRTAMKETVVQVAFIGLGIGCIAVIRAMLFPEAH